VSEYDEEEVSIKGVVSMKGVSNSSSSSSS